MILTRKLLEVFADKKNVRVERSKLPLFLGNEGILRITSPKGEAPKITGNVLVDRSLTFPIQVINWENDPVGAPYISKVVNNSLEVRKLNKCGVDIPRSAFRLVNGLADGLPGLAIDMYGLYAVIHVYSQHWQLMVMEIAKSLLHIDRRVEGVYMINRTRQVGSNGDVPTYSDDTKSKSQCIWGKRAPEHRTIVEENGLLYHVQFDNGPALGLYMDQRVNRVKLTELLKRVRAEGAEQSGESFSRAPRFLNTFCFTGSFSVAAAKHVDAITTNVDASELALVWAKDNFALNGLDPNRGHEFIKKDVFSALVGFFSQQRQFDVILLDPPTISRVKVRNPSTPSSSGGQMASYIPSLTAQSKTHFSAMDNYNDLVALAAPLVAPGGYLVCFVNTHSLDQEKWRHSIEQGLESIIPRIRNQLGEERMNQVRAYLRKRGVKVKHRKPILAKLPDAFPSDDLIRDHFGFQIVDEWLQDTSDFRALEGDKHGQYLHGLVLKRNRFSQPIPPVSYPVIKSDMLHESKRGGDTVKGSKVADAILNRFPDSLVSSQPSSPFTPPTTSTLPKIPKGPWNNSL
jgi:23S rRNA (cytosine1962-C5)-methyltransferase